MKRIFFSLFILISIVTITGCIPIITSLTASPNPVAPSGTMTATVTAIKTDTGTLSYTWTATTGWTITGYGPTATVVAPPEYNTTGALYVSVTDSLGGTATRSLVISTTTAYTFTVGSAPWGIAVDASDNIWVSNFLDSTITKLSNTGTIIGTYSDIGGYGPAGIAIDASGNVWVANGNWGSDNLTELKPTGSFMGAFSVGHTPYCVAIDASGNIWVANSSANGNDPKVTKLNSSGVLIGSFVVGAAPPFGIAIDASGNAWVTFLNNTVTELSPTGTTIATYPVGMTPHGIAIDQSGNVWVANHDDGTITKLAHDGTTTETFYIGNHPQAVAVDSIGNVWVTNDSDNGGITELNSNGTIIQNYPMLQSTMGIAIDSSGNVWVTNNSNNTVTKLVGVTVGPEFFPYSGPQFPGGGNF